MSKPSRYSREQEIAADLLRRLQPRMERLGSVNQRLEFLERQVFWMRLAIIVMAGLLLAYIVPPIAAGLLTGVLCGLLPYGVGRMWRRPRLGIAGAVGCVLSGLAFGATLAVSVACVVTIMIVWQGPAARSLKQHETDVLDEDDYRVDR